MPALRSRRLGNWMQNDYDMRVSYRFGDLPTDRSSMFGFRVSR